MLVRIGWCDGGGAMVWAGRCDGVGREGRAVMVVV